MNGVRSIVMAALFFSASWLFWFNGEDINSWVSEARIVTETTPHPLLGLQSDERWLVIVIDFPGNPATHGSQVEDAQSLLNQAALPYVEQLSGGKSNLIVDVFPNIIRASNGLSAYGVDGTSKDTDNNGNFLPAQLAEEVVLAVKDEVNWENFDLDSDGTIDRFLILHSTKGQEENPTLTNRIWSHFTRFEAPIDLPRGRTIDHYTMGSLQTGSSGVGTILHEMLHQMGAADLYPVHEETLYQSWKGPGDWDIMANGNWNGGGRWPALPSGATLELIQASRVKEVHLEWPSSSASPCFGPSIPLVGLSQGGEVLKIQIAKDEFVYIELRSDFGFDERLPGHGVLVTYQDLSVGDVDQNELNSNPNLPWLKVIEADGRNELLSGSNEGESSDVFSNNMSFGASGVPIRTHDGLLVPWTATIHVNENGTAIDFIASQCSPTFGIELPDHGTTLLPHEDILVNIQGVGSQCTSALTSSDGRDAELLFINNEYFIRYSQTGSGKSIISGTISCDSSKIDLQYSVEVLNRIPTLQSFEGIIDPFENTELELPIPSRGEGDQFVYVTIDGPLSRVGSATNRVNLNEGALTLKIEPNGLLTENMLVRGTIQLMTEDGIGWEMEIELQAKSGELNGMIPYFQPFQLISLLCALIGVASLFSKKKRTNPPVEQQTLSYQSSSVGKLDPWGRPVDEHELTTSFDLEEPRQF